MAKSTPLEILISLIFPLDGDMGGLPELSMGGGMGSEDPVDRLRSMIGERQEETVEILRGWLAEEEKV